MEENGINYELVRLLHSIPILELEIRGRAGDGSVVQIGTTWKEDAYRNRKRMATVPMRTVQLIFTVSVSLSFPTPFLFVKLVSSYSSSVFPRLRGTKYNLKAKNKTKQNASRYVVWGCLAWCPHRNATPWILSIGSHPFHDSALPSAL